MFKKCIAVVMGCSIMMATAAGVSATEEKLAIPYKGKDHPCKSSSTQFNATLTKEVVDKGGVISLMEPSLSSKPHEKLPTKLFYGTHMFNGVVHGEEVNGSDKWYVVHNMWANTYIHSSNFEKDVKCLW
ncbi:hypothetical protein SAMN04487866_12430 [Thermoactinomyces sp. DSM 45891]|uniref:hypothetical protein n=1 Tax=Thermoactinomyces sp. DSM 45891 TaxID=1761907 RepID=UPI000918B5A0|nr:hypothetical protein [Thermoactinomyces sp. DSM 45891]SFX77480.1 hypothetical protein SAMN04487866_12430 [Thermoactinomyces sp. DSM 45891]